MSTRNTSRFEIARYWASKPEWQFVCDLGEPSCFACGYYDEHHWDRPATAEKRWNGTNLQRAHIIADSIGGEDKPENLLLLCARCHRDSPMTNDPEVLLFWTAARPSYYSTIWQLWMQELSKVEVPLDNVNLAGFQEFFTASQNDIFPMLPAEDRSIVRAQHIESIVRAFMNSEFYEGPLRPHYPVIVE